LVVGSAMVEFKYMLSSTPRRRSGLSQIIHSFSGAWRNNSSYRIESSGMFIMECTDWTGQMPTSLCKVSMDNLFQYNDIHLLE
jgi:hypothetical protein